MVLHSLVDGAWRELEARADDAPLLEVRIRVTAIDRPRTMMLAVPNTCVSGHTKLKTKVEW